MINIYGFYGYLQINFMYEFIFYHNIMAHFNNSSKVFYLKFPKLLCSYEASNLVNKKILSNIKSPIIDMSSNSININAAKKLDKKYKNDLHNNNILDTKKNRNKIVRKGRKKIDIEQDELFINSNNILSSDSKSFLKSDKVNKYKKKDNYKSSFFNNTLHIDNKNNEIIINRPLSVYELSMKLNIPEAEIITYLFLKGLSVTINDIIDISTAKEIAYNYNFNIVDEELILKNNVNKLYNNTIQKQNIKRAPIITIFGHVDHGKTTLLDSILSTNLVKQEFGGITQSINAYEIEWLYSSKIYKLVFLDTPGHEAFASMRLRGAKITDIVLLVIAADDGLKPQSIEAIKYILEMKLSYIVVINKIDKKDINLLKIKEELVTYDIIPEEWGGNAKVIEVSALKGKNLDLLLSNMCQLADAKSLTADPNQLAEGTVLEAYLDKKQGIIANIVVQNGTLKIGDLIIAGNTYGKIKNLINYQGISIKQAGPSSVIRVLGFSVVPKSGILFSIMNNDKDTKKYLNNVSKEDNKILNHNSKLFSTNITNNDQKSIKQLNVIIKTNTQGSLEAVIDALSKISQQKIQIHIISADSGNISSTNIELALATNALILGFNINISSYIYNLAKQNSLNIQVFHIIYDLIEYIQNYMLNLIDTEYDLVFIGRAIVQTIFYINKKIIVGCLVNEGKLKKMSHINIYRNSSLVYEGKLISLKRIKNDVDEVIANNECGVMCDYDLWEKMDVIKAYDLKPKQKSL